MKYSSLHQLIADLERHGHLIRISEEVDPHLEMAAIHRRVNAGGGPALFFQRLQGCSFPAVSNLFGTLERTRFIFRSTEKQVKKLIQFKLDPIRFFTKPFSYASVPFTALNALPRKVRTAPILFKRTSIDQLPQIKAWPRDGGTFITLPQVYSENPKNPGVMLSNVGMYRIQMSGNEFKTNDEVGLHYQLHRGIGVHHTQAIQSHSPLKVSIFIGGPPAHMFAAVMPLPEDLAEVSFAGALAGRRFRYLDWEDYRISADADFCIVGDVYPEAVKPEGPFGDHLGYYSLKHNFPVLKVRAVFHKPDAVWPFTVVGRPPQEDTNFNHYIQELTGPVIPKSIPGVKEINAVDEAGVHPLLLAIGSERYIPFENREPREILTMANAILGFGQLSLAKYLFIAAKEDNPQLSVYNIEPFFVHLLERIDWARDLHFQTQTTIDTLDYTGHGLNRGSKVVFAAAGKKRRTLLKDIPGELKIPGSLSDPMIVLPGVIALKGPKFENPAQMSVLVKDLENHLKDKIIADQIALLVIVDDSQFVSASLANFLWIAFTRSDPAQDIYGIFSFMSNKHWGCEGPLVIDARIKPHHAPVLEEDPKIQKQIERLGQKGASLHGII